MDVKNIRKLNALVLAKEVGGISALAELVDSSQSYLSQIIGLNGKRDMGDDLARRIESAASRPVGWMDQSHIEDAKQEKVNFICENLLRMDEAYLDAVIVLLQLTKQRDLVSRT